MKKTYFILLTSLIILGIYSCQSKQEQNQELQTINGLVMDATMNNIILITTSGDTVNISTMDTDQAQVPGVLINDSVAITYAMEKVGTNDIRKATKLVVTHHSPYFYIAGTWIEPNPINTTEVQGFTLNPDGTASSVNMATLIFKNWQMNDATLLLTSESIGNKQTITGTDTLQIVKLDADSLILSQQANIVWHLKRQ